MYYKTKYIIVDTGMGIIPILFSELAAHNEVARAYPNKPIVGAGFAALQNANPYENPQYACYGESVSLQIKSRGDEDSKIVNRYLGLSF